MEWSGVESRACNLSGEGNEKHEKYTGVHVPRCSLSKFPSRFQASPMLYSFIPRSACGSWVGAGFLLSQVWGYSWFSGLGHDEIFMAFFWSVSISRTNEALRDWALWRPIDRTGSAPSMAQKCLQTTSLHKETTTRRLLATAEESSQDSFRGALIPPLFNFSLQPKLSHFSTKQAPKHH